MLSRDVDVTELADWLVRQGPEALWTVDGEASIEGELSLPCDGDELAAALRAHGGRIRIYYHEAPGPDLAAGGDLGAYAAREDDTRVFQVAWVENGVALGDVWLLVEDRLAQLAVEQSAAHV